MAKMVDRFAGERLGPDQTQDLGKIAPGQWLDILEHLGGAAADIGQLEVGVYHIDPERVRYDQIGESLGVARQQFLCAALLGDIAVNPHPLANAAIGIEDGNGADRAQSPLPIMAANPVLKNEWRLGVHRSLPGIDRGLGIVGMHGVGPAITLVLIEGLPGQFGPLGLFADHHALGIVGP